MGETPQINFTGELRNENFFYLAAEIGGEIAGRAGFKFFLEDAEIELFEVEPKFQGRGVAKKLLAELIERVRGLNLQTIILDVRVSNIPALHILQKFGFKIVGRRKFFCDGEDTVTLRADLGKL